MTLQWELISLYVLLHVQYPGHEARSLSLKWMSSRSLLTRSPEFRRHSNLNSLDRPTDVQSGAPRGRKYCVPGTLRACLASCAPTIVSMSTFILSTLFLVQPFNFYLGCASSRLCLVSWTLLMMRIALRLMVLLLLQFDHDLGFACLLILLALDLGFELLCDLHTYSNRVSTAFYDPTPSRQQGRSSFSYSRSTLYIPQPI